MTGTGMQVNIWRGQSEPPTLYHVWIKDDDSLYLYSKVDKKWNKFLDSTDFKTVIDKIQNDLDSITVNGKHIVDNPILNASDISINQDGNYVMSGDTLQKIISTFDNLFKTCVID